MESYSVVIILLTVAIGLYPVAAKMKLPYPVLLLIAGVGVGFIPGFRPISIQPEVVFLLFLPPMLYDAAYHISFKDFKLNIQTISLMAIALVFVTTTGIAVAVYYCIPGMTWPLSFVIGAILSPPDAIAATSVTKGLGLPPRTMTVLEGESLINDASALVAFRFAVAAVAGSAFVPLDAGWLFLVALIGGLLLGWFLLHVFLFLARKRLDKNVIVSLNLMLPFVAYLIAEDLHVSGVIAVVTVGLLVSRHKEKLPEPTVVQSKTVLDAVLFILNGLVFVLIGLEFPHVLKNIPHDAFFPLTGCAFLIFGVALLIRMAVIFWHKGNTQRRYVIIQKRFTSMNKPGGWKPFVPPQTKRAKFLKRGLQACSNEACEPAQMEQVQTPFRQVGRSLDEQLEIFKSLLLTGKEAILIGWSGMRGIVSLAAALSLPLVVADGSAFPERDTIIFITVVTVIIMLVVQGLGLRLLTKVLKIKK
jgi:CPA1 family monovalent cation:H+ antiporter